MMKKMTQSHKPPTRRPGSDVVGHCCWFNSRILKSDKTFRRLALSRKLLFGCESKPL